MENKIPEVTKIKLKKKAIRSTCLDVVSQGSRGLIESVLISIHNISGFFYKILIKNKILQCY